METTVLESIWARTAVLDVQLTPGLTVAHKGDKVAPGLAAGGNNLALGLEEGSGLKDEIGKGGEIMGWKHEESWLVGEQASFIKKQL